MRIPTFDAAERWVADALRSPPEGVFRHADVGDIPQAAARWLTHAIPDGTPCHRACELTQRGTIRLNGRWWPFAARQVLAPTRGMVWKADARMQLGLSVRGHDLYHDGRGEMRWKLLGLIPVITARGEDVARSARGRTGAEACLWPTALIGPHVSWSHVDDRVAEATLAVDGDAQTVRVEVAPDGRLERATMRRWGNPGGGAFGSHDFGVEVLEEGERGGLTIPCRVSVGWYFGTARFAEEGEFFRGEIVDATPSA